MIYVYDVVLNFNKVYYEFFEWREEDEILNFKKIPLFRVDNNDYLSLKYDDVILDEEFMAFLGECCFINSKNKNVIACLVSDGREVVGLLIGTDGKILGRSSLLFDEEEDVLSEVDDLRRFSLKYNLVDKNLFRKELVSRVVSDKRQYLLYFFNSNNNINLYRYIYYDFYEKEETDVLKIKRTLMEILNKGWDSNCEKLYNSVKLICGVR